VTTKVSQLARTLPRPVPIADTGMRIIIDILPNGTSTMKAEGGVNQILIALVLSAQLNTLLPNMFKDVFQSASGVTGPDGMPILRPKVPNTMEVHTESGTTHGTRVEPEKVAE
jgi:hypothetical protein